MRVKRALVLTSMLVSLGLASSLTFFAMDEPIVEADPASRTFGQETIPQQGFEPGAQPSIREDNGAMDFSTLVQWAGAVVFALAFVVSFILFRVEVRREKDVLRARRQREDYYKDLRKYNAQLKGPPEENT